MGFRVDGEKTYYGNWYKVVADNKETTQSQEVKNNSAVTVPVGQPVTNNQETKSLTGLEVETNSEAKAANNQQQVDPVKQFSENGKKRVEETKQLLVNADIITPDGQLKKHEYGPRVYAKRTITDDASFKSKEDEMAQNYYQVRSMSDDEVKAFAKKYVENELPQDADKKLVADTENGIIEAYTHIRSMSNEDIRKTAKYYANNVRNQENFGNTVVYYDKAEYKAAEAQRKEARKQLVAQFKNEGLSKKEAKKKADSMLVKNEYLRKTWFGIHSARKAVNNNRELFFDENGKFSNEKYHEFALKQANINNQNAGEETDYTFSLKERRKADIDEVLKGSSMTTLGKVVRKSGLETERNNTALYRGLAIAALVGAGAATGGITAVATAGSASASTAGAAAGSAAAGAASGAAAGATATAHISGAFLGAAASPLALLLKDKGRADGHALKIFSYTEKPQPQPQPVPQPEPQPEPQPCPTQEWDEKVCTHKVIPGSSWCYYAEKSGITINGKKPAGNMLNSYLYAQQLMYGIKNPKGLRETRFLPVGAEYVQHSDFSKLYEDADIMNKYGRYLNPLKDAEINVDNCVELNGRVRGRRNPRYRFGGFVRNNTQIAHYSQDCHQNVPVVTYR